MCIYTTTQHVFQQRVFSADHGFQQKKQGWCFSFKSNLNTKNLKCIKKPATLFKKRLRYRCFPVNFAKFLRETFFYRTPLLAASFHLINTRNKKIKPQIHPTTSFHQEHKEECIYQVNRLTSVTNSQAVAHKAGWQNAFLLLCNFSQSNKHCIHLSTTKAIYFFRFVFPILIYNKSTAEYKCIQFLSYGSHYHLFFSVQAQTELVEELWSKSLHCHLYFHQNNHFLIIFSVFLSLNQNLMKLEKQS